jgi:very-short-patch-repair endonuclease
VQDLADKVLSHLAESGPANPKQIAAALGLDRTLVNQALYGALKGQVRQGKDYRWSIVGKDAPRTASPATARAPNSYQGLFSYYLDCLSQDDDAGVSVFANSKYELDYVELTSWPLEGTVADGDPEPLRKLLGRQRGDSRKKALWIGYPVVVRSARNNRTGWEPSFVEPLLLWLQDTESGDFSFLPEPMLNLRAIRSLTRADNALDEAVLLADELSLDSADPPPLDELVLRLRALRQGWPWKEPLLPAPFRGVGDLRKLSEFGIYNAAIAVLADRSPYTAGLERDLTDLKSVSDADLGRSSLGVLLGKAGPIVEDDQSLLLEAAPLNTEQRVAVRDALRAPLTVITGPPGTGKSQVVSAILVNAAWRGMRVLFASKNNKAVDVVLDRVNGLTVRPTMLRLGARAFQEQLAQHLSSILSSRTTEDDRQAYKDNLSRLKRVAESLTEKNRAYEGLIRLRNRVDALEQAAESARTLLGDRAFGQATAILASDLSSKISLLGEAIRRADRREASFVDRMVWPLRKETLERRRAQAAVAVRDVMMASGISQRIVVDPDALLSQAKAALEGAQTVADYKTALRDLGDQPDVGTMSAEIAREADAVGELSLESWRGWTALLPDRLTDNDRKAVGDYAALLRTITKAEQDRSTIARQIWTRYYELAGQVSKALPAWAVTSLSVRGRIPLNAGEFDLVVIDEASQCDIASALPLLYRAKRAVIIGDPQQLRHISRLSLQRDQSLMVKHSLLDTVGPSWSYRANGLYDLAASRITSDAVVVLRDHHRSHAAIINFSNEFFYGGRLRVATNYRRLKRPAGPAVRWVDVKGRVVRPLGGSALNQEEAAAVVSELRRLVVEQRFPGEVGVVTPFRAQANRIDELVRQDDALSAVLAARNFAAETAHRFQGDERDVMLFSPVVSSGTPDSATGFLESQGNLFNVGITRARGALVIVGDMAACAAGSVNYLAAFAKYVADLSEAPEPDERSDTLEPAGLGPEYPSVARPERVSDWEKVLYSALVAAGLRPHVQYEVDRYALDFALIRPNGRKLNIEVDGEHYHRDWNGELIRRDQLRNLRMIELGWDVMRFWVYQVRDDLPGCVQKVAQWAAKADSAASVVSKDERRT